jgi:hypothetical protein
MHRLERVISGDKFRKEVKETRFPSSEKAAWSKQRNRFSRLRKAGLSVPGEGLTTFERETMFLSREKAGRSYIRICFSMLMKTGLS